MQAVDERDEDGGSAGALSLDLALAAIMKRGKLVVLTTIFAAAVTAFLVSIIPNTYEAAATIQIDPRQKSITALDSVVSDLKGDQATIESEVEIVQSRPIVLRVIETLGLRNDPEFVQPPLSIRIKSWLGFKTPALIPMPERELPAVRDQIADLIDPIKPGESKPERDEIAAGFYSRMKVMRVRNTLLIEIKFQATSAEKAARIVNTIAEVYLKEQLDAKTGAAHTATRILEEKLHEMRIRVSDAERKVEQWKALNGVFDTEGQILSEKHLARLMEQTVIARNTTSEARAKFEQAQKLARQGDGGTAIVEVLQSHTVRLLKEQLATATRRAAELATRYGPRHPEILKSQAEVSQAQSQVNGEIDRLVTNLKNEAEVADSRERQLAQSLAQLKEQQIVSKDAGVDLKELEREAITSKQLFEALLARYKQTAETQGFQLPDARIVQRADIPLYPTSPKRKQLVAVSAVTGLLTGLALAVLFELMAPGILRGRDIRRVLFTDHLASLPQVVSQGDVQGNHRAIRLVVAEPSGLYADCIRNARRELDSKRQDDGARIILVTSSMPGEGAITLASNLAHHYALSTGSALLIDGDFRLQTLTKQLAPQRMTGLLDQFATGIDVSASILRDGVTGLHFLPAAGPTPTHVAAAEAVGSKMMCDAIIGLKSTFNTIVICAPPMLPVIDARIFADYADQIVFVMAWQRTPRELAKRALTSLGSNAAKLAGVILNDVPQDSLTETTVLASIFGRPSVVGPELYQDSRAA